MVWDQYFVTKHFRYLKWRNPHLYMLSGCGLCRGSFPTPKNGRSHYPVDFPPKKLGVFEKKMVKFQHRQSHYFTNLKKSKNEGRLDLNESTISDKKKIVPIMYITVHLFQICQHRAAEIPPHKKNCQSTRLFCPYLSMYSEFCTNCFMS